MISGVKGGPYRIKCRSASGQNIAGSRSAGGEDGMIGEPAEATRGSAGEVAIRSLDMARRYDGGQARCGAPGPDSSRGRSVPGATTGIRRADRLATGSAPVRPARAAGAI